MLKTYNESLFERFTGLNRNSVILGAKQRNQILSRCKNVRSRDYIVLFDSLPVGAGAVRRSFTTAANWHYILTNISCFWHDDGAAIAPDKYPIAGINFVNFAPSSPFGTDVKEMGKVETALVFGREAFQDKSGNQLHFEEAANLYYNLGQRFDVLIDAEENGQAARGGVILQGIEVSNEALKSGEVF